MSCDPDHFEHFIVQWLITGNNFASWRSPPDDQPKIKVAKFISSLLNIKELRREFTPQMVYNKITHIEGQMGLGLKEYDPLSLYDKVSFVFLHQKWMFVDMLNSPFGHELNSQFKQ